MSRFLVDLAWVASGIVAYEVLRSFVLRSAARRIERSVREFIREAHLSREAYRFASKVVVIDEMMNDPVLNEEILRKASRDGIRIEQARALAERYLEEIVPSFNLLSYYQVGYRVARAIVNGLYEVVVDRTNLEAVQRLPRRSVVIFVANHRSNVDYVLMAYLLARHITLSYAVGEWARVWPLEHLFKSFGSYFVRRGFRDDFYHTVLKRYVQHISARGITQGIFLEGGLSRDGQLREPKVGLLDYLVQLKADPEFQSDLVFVPVGINFDWVLEDEHLLAEHAGRVTKPTLADKAASLTRLLVLGPPTLIANAWRLATGRIKRHGYASVRIGAPVSFDEYALRTASDPEAGSSLAGGTRASRVAAVKDFADHLMHAIARAIPVTPIPLACAALQRLGPGPVTHDALRAEIARLRKSAEARGAAVVMGHEFEAERGARERLGDERADRRGGLVEFEEAYLDAGEARVLLDCALEVLVRRRVVRIRAGAIEIRPDKQDVVRYYANSIRRHLEPDGSATESVNA
ncbi:MAG: 1-acyl-sn-glycerol-3-phosphate acyltransferase [bacterium]